MKGFGKILGLLALVGVAVFVLLVIRRSRQSNSSSPSRSCPTGAGEGNQATATGQKCTISRELLEILADPEDKGPVELVVMDGKEWLVNRRNGYRYPVENGIPIMLIEEGRKYQDKSLITASS